MKISEYLKKNYLTLILIVLCVLFGALLIVFSKNSQLLIRIASYVIGIGIVIVGIIFMIINLKNTNYTHNSTNKLWENPKFRIVALSCLVIAIGILIIVFHNYILRVIAGVILIAIMVIKIISSSSKLETFLANVLTLIIGLVLILSFESLFSTVLIVCGSLCFLLALFLIVMLFIIYHNQDDKNVLFYLLRKIYKF